MDKYRSDVCGCGGKGTTNHRIPRLVEIITRAEMLARQEAEEEQRDKDADKNDQNMETR